MAGKNEHRVAQIDPKTHQRLAILCASRNLVQKHVVAKAINDYCDRLERSQARREAMRERKAAQA